MGSSSSSRSGCLEQQLAQRDAAPLAAGQVGDRLVAGRAAQRVHGLLDAAVEFPALGVLDLLHQLALLGQQRVEVGVGLAHGGRHLLEAGQRGRAARRRRPRRSRGPSWSRPAAAPAAAARRWRRRPAAASPLEAWSSPAMIFSTRRLAGAVRADHADLGAGQERQGDVVEDDLVAVRLAHLVHGVDELSHCPSPADPVDRAPICRAGRGCVPSSVPAVGRARTARTGRASGGARPARASPPSRLVDRLVRVGACGRTPDASPRRDRARSRWRRPSTLGHLDPRTRATW